MRIRPELDHARVEVSSISRWMPRTGMPTQSGRLSSSYWSSYTAFSSSKTESSRSIAADPGRQERRVDRLEIALEEPRARLLLPPVRRLDVAQQRDGARGIRERAQHPGHVAQRGALAAPLGERARRLALEVEDHPVVVRPHGLAEVVVAVRADELARSAGVRELAQLVADLLAAARDRRHRLLIVRQRDEDARDLLVDGRRQQAERLDARRLGTERGIVRLGGEHRVHLAGHLAEPAETGQEALGLLGELVERELPAVEPAAHVLLQDPERGRERPARVRVPAAERSDVREAVLGEEAQHLQLGVEPGLEPAEDLEDELVVEDDGRVRLLGADVACVVQLAAETGEPGHGAKLDDAFGSLEREPGAHRADELAREAEGLLLRERATGRCRAPRCRSAARRVQARTADRRRAARRSPAPARVRRRATSPRTSAAARCRR